ncbi:Nonribosomal peptide synthetase-like protein [Tolypocladium paradoxum]|uniref:Nonribosomal peptide synthetase-like protein n=1 Tax=Tolypocladium paradoxum TaxID=94208 RepID=A0A2S4L741_9HYPO|nr:Nonribosomal peptide synthetase-like protein [Tolypocladium paradoxum]
MPSLSEVPEDAGPSRANPAVGPVETVSLEVGSQALHRNFFTSHTMEDYWRKALAGCESVPFPLLPASGEQPSADTVLMHRALPIQEGTAEIAASTVVRAAWAMVVGRMTNSKDVVFGVTTNSPATTPTEAGGSTMGTFPVRVILPADQSISEYLRTLQQQATEMIPFEQAGVENISKICPEARDACMFQTLLVMQPQVSSCGSDQLEKHAGSHSHKWSTGYAMVLEVQPGENQTRLTAHFDSGVVKLWIVRSLLRQLDFAMQQLQESDAKERYICDIKLARSDDLQEIWEWNGSVPTSVDRCVHEIIKERAAARPNAPAICAWDGQLTYNELDRLATGLAGRLVELGAGPDVNVPLCFEKSMWTTVAMLGVLKAGAAFVLLEPSIPEYRLQCICRQANAKIVVSGHSSEALSSRLAPQVVALGPRISKDLYDQPRPNLHPPNPGSAMYLAFTSGSTGTPKGAVITHRNLASALYYQESSLKRTAESRVYDFCSYSFDVSICNVFTTLAAGGCFCVPNEQDRRNRLAESIASLDANAIDLTPSVARLLSPDQVPGLRTIIFGGEALHIKDVNPWWGKVQIVNLYGPCECTPNSTINCNPTSPEDAVHIGKGVGLVTWIVDAENHDSLLPLGCIGELLLEGPLVGSGYVNEPEKTAATFIEDPLWLLQGAPGRPGRHGRLYKTGDLVRYNEDGSLTFFGRKDAQVKIRGQRVELGEIEQILRSHRSVDDAAVVLQPCNGQDAQISGFVTVSDCEGALEEQPNSGEEGQLIDVWERHFDIDTYSLVDTIRPEDIGRDFIGWTSMYDGKSIDIGELNEWLDDTMETILNGEAPGHVLEIGTGSGMILFNMTAGLQSYVGLEPAERAVEFVIKTAKSIPELADKVKLYKAAATDLHRLDAAISPNLVVVNSVIQYFPSQGYLFSVVQNLLSLQGVRTIFFGDIRSYPLHRQFLATRALHMVAENVTKDEVRRMIADMEKAESELLVDPAFFTGLPSRLPGQIKHVEILPKKVYATNELSCYRYAAVIYAKSQSIQPPLKVHDIGQHEWIDFTERGLDRQSLSELLDPSFAPPVIAVGNIPHRKTLFERQLVDLLNSQGDEKLDPSSNWVASVRQKAHEYPALSAVDLAEMAVQAGYRVEVSWARQYSQRGGLDAIFHRYKTDSGRGRVMFRFPGDHQDRPYHALSSHPLRQHLRQTTQDQLQKMLRTRLPSYMVPEVITILDKMPLNDNGKTDHRALAEALQMKTAGQGPAEQPTSEAEQQLRTIWSQVLNIEPSNIRLGDSFFRLGGNSIAAMRVVGEARMVGLDLTVTQIFKHPELHELAGQARDLHAQLV